MAPFFHDEPGPDTSLPFAYLNVGKRSLTLNLKSEEGRDILRSLLPETDVLVENFAPAGDAVAGVGLCLPAGGCAAPGDGVHLQLRADRALP